MNFELLRMTKRGLLAAKLMSCNTTEAATTDVSSRASMLHKTVNFKPNMENYNVSSS